MVAGITYIYSKKEKSISYLKNKFMKKLKDVITTRTGTLYDNIVISMIKTMFDESYDLTLEDKINDDKHKYVSHTIEFNMCDEGFETDYNEFYVIKLLTKFYNCGIDNLIIVDKYNKFWDLSKFYNVDNDKSAVEEVLPPNMYLINFITHLTDKDNTYYISNIMVPDIHHVELVKTFLERMSEEDEPIIDIYKCNLEKIEYKEERAKLNSINDSVTVTEPIKSDINPDIESDIKSDVMLGVPIISTHNFTISDKSTDEITFLNARLNELREFLVSGSLKDEH